MKYILIAILFFGLGYITGDTHRFMEPEKKPLKEELVDRAKEYGKDKLRDYILK